MRARHETRTATALRVCDLSYAYPGGEFVLRDISCSIAAGESVVLVGLSGCGKTTLCHCLSGLAPKALGGTLRGAVFLAGEDIAPLPLSRLASRIGFVFQDPDNQMVTTTVEDEIAFAPENLAMSPAEIRVRVSRELERFGIAHLAPRAPNSLSGGEKRLVAMAAVLALDPSVLILDEPFTHLDERGRVRVREAIADMQREGRTLIVVEHDLSLADFAHRYLLLAEGRLASDTTMPPPAFLDPEPGAAGNTRVAQCSLARTLL